MGKYLDIARKFEARRAEAVSAEQPATPPIRSLSSMSEPAPWLCEHCGLPAEIEAVEPRKDDGALLTYWQCTPCQVWSVTPSTLRQPPVWVRKSEQ